MNQEKIGKFIAKCRKEKKLTQEALAFKLGVSDRTIGNWENGRNMPDLSLFKPLSEELDITINELISGERIKEDNIKQKLEENIITTIDYTNRKIKEKNNLIGLILIIFGVLISFTAMCMFESESSWGSIYSVFGGIVSLIGVSKFTKKLQYSKRLVCNFGYFIIFLLLLFIIDFIGVINIKQAPRFSLNKLSTGSVIYYDTIFYDVIRCDANLKTESWHIENNKNYDYHSVTGYCDNIKKENLKEIIKSAANTKLIVIGKYVDNIEKEKTYINSLDGIVYEPIKKIEDEKEIKKFLEILNKGKYSQGINAVRDHYLVQLSNNGSLILEFTNNYIQDNNQKIGFYFENLDKKEIENYINKN